jgi:hypothetical protein
MNTYHKQQIKIYVNLLLLLFQRKKHLLQRRKRKVRRIWARKWLQRRNENRGISHLVFNELEDPASFKNFTRMSVATFHEFAIKSGTNNQKTRYGVNEKQFLQNEGNLLSFKILQMHKVLLSMYYIQVTISLEIPCHWRELYKSTVRFSDICS